MCMQEHRAQKRATDRSPGAGITGGFEPLSGGWDPNSGCLQERYAVTLTV